MKKVILIIIILILIVAIYIIFNSGAPDNVEEAVIKDDAGEMMSEEEAVFDNLNQRLSEFRPEDFKFNFIGFGPGKSHLGEFKNYSFKDIETEDNKIKNGKLVFDLKSVETGIETLNSHLCKDDFFDCENHPEAYFEFKKAERVDENTLRVTGNLQIKGINKEVTFNVTESENTYTADFLLNTEEFGFNVALADSDVQIKFEAKL